MPFFAPAHSSATALVKRRTPPLLARCPRERDGTKPATDEIFAIDPPPDFAISGIAVLQPRNMLSRLIDICRRQLSKLISSSGLEMQIAALLTSTCSESRSRAIAAMACAHASSRATSRWSAFAEPPSFAIWAQRSAAPVSSMSETTTWAPSRAKASPQARPMPLPAPLRAFSLQDGSPLPPIDGWAANPCLAALCAARRGGNGVWHRAAHRSASLRPARACEFDEPVDRRPSPPAARMEHVPDMDHVRPYLELGVNSGRSGAPVQGEQIIEQHLVGADVDQHRRQVAGISEGGRGKRVRRIGAAEISVAHSLRLRAVSSGSLCGSVRKVSASQRMSAQGLIATSAAGIGRPASRAATRTQPRVRRPPNSPPIATSVVSPLSSSTR